MKNSRVQIPLRITPAFIDCATYHIERVDAQLGYQAQEKYRAAKRWVEGAEKNEYIWLGIAGAATPAGLGGLVADLIERGLVDVIISTGANVYHDLHFAFCLPVRHGSQHADDEDLRRCGTTRIYTQFIDNDYTLKAQDKINEDIAREILPRLSSPFSTTMFLYEFGKHMLEDESGLVIDKKGSFVVRAAEYGVPIFLDSGSNHSLGMDLSLHYLKGLKVDTSPSRDIIQAAALSIYTQPQLNIFLGEGGPRNFTQTTAPTASEIFHIPFEGSAGCIRFTTADERTGGLSGSGESEAVSWGKYRDADPSREIVVWGEYTLTAPDVMAYVAGKSSKGPKRLMDNLFEIENKFIEETKRNGTKLERDQERLMKSIRDIQAHEKHLREREGYEFE